MSAISGLTFSLQSANNLLIKFVIEVDVPSLHEEIAKKIIFSLCEFPINAT